MNLVFCYWIKLHHDNEILFNLINYQIELFDCTHSSIKVIRWINTLLNMFHANHIWNIKYIPQTYQGQSKHKLSSDGLGRALPSLILSFLFLPMNTTDNREPCWCWASLLQWSMTNITGKLQVMSVYFKWTNSRQNSEKF